MRISLLLIFTIVLFSASAQDIKKFNVYKPLENATTAIRSAVAKAEKEKKHVLVQVGGNWCSWCAKFYNFTKTNAAVDSLLQSSFIVYHLNYSPENRNLATLAKYSFPQRFGFPVFLILDGEGRLLHTQNSAYLEEGNGYSKEKVIDFLSSWTTTALDPAKYKAK